MRKSALFLIIVLGGVLFFWNGIWELYSKIIPALPPVERETSLLVQEVKERISTPPPLIVEVRIPESFLTQAGVLQWTNTQRQKQGLSPLKENPQLNTAALLKAQDMLAKQYFGHISPSGQGVGDLANRAGYEFIAIGENLALGDFENDESLVQGWMASPGHRANILNLQYQEIGAAVLQGEYEGRLTWLAVQHFGLPLASCPQPSGELLEDIARNQNQIEQFYYALSELQKEIEAMRPRRGDIFNQKVEEYNNLVLQYNTLIDKTKLLIEQYNNQVRLFNQCASGA